MPHGKVFVGTGLIYVDFSAPKPRGKRDAEKGEFSEVLRPTTKDLARAAGVSLATVDRVLNGRAGVREETVVAVQEAIARIGFERNLQAANLARGRIYRFAFFLPEAGDLFLAMLKLRIDEASHALRAEGMQISARAEISENPHQIAALLAGLGPADLDGIALMAPESPPLRDAIARLRQRGVQVVHFLSGRMGGEGVGIDNRAAGASAARLLGRFCGPTRGQVLVISDRMHGRDAIERRQGFDLVLARDFPHLQALPSVEIRHDAARAEMVLRNAYGGNRAIIAAYVLSSEARQPLEALAAVSDTRAQVILAHERTSFTEALLQDGQLDAVIAQNPGHLVRSAIRLLRARCDARAPLASQEEIRIEILLRENLGLSSPEPAAFFSASPPPPRGLR